MKQSLSNQALTGLSAALVASGAMLGASSGIGGLAPHSDMLLPMIGLVAGLGLARRALATFGLVAWPLWATMDALVFHKSLAGEFVEVAVLLGSGIAAGYLARMFAGRLQQRSL